VVTPDLAFDVRIDIPQDPRSQRLTVEVTGSGNWKSEEPEWGGVGYGFSAERFFLWSARRLIWFQQSGRAPETLQTDEDLLWAFPLADGWLLVCELSARLYRNGREVHRISPADVVVDAKREGATFVLRDFEGRLYRLVVRESGIGFEA
jgi:hypothetical protein